jgi:hypothetical protein
MGNQIKIQFKGAKNIGNDSNKSNVKSEILSISFFKRLETANVKLQI